MGNIVLLDDLTINKIAAGEVVERPASVVKEMVENSIDAGATNISIEIKNGGISYIRITDNGKGIAKDDMEIAFERHATSKIRNANDLNYIKSMGFRGEALASIAAIANVEMISKTGMETTGNKIVVEAGNVLSFEETGCPVGTTITVQNLFFNTPVRYKFLKKDYTESGYIEDYVTRLALVNPSIAFKLINSGKTILQTSGNGNLNDVIYAIFGEDITRSVLNVDYPYENIKITGAIGKPEIARSNRSNQMFFINKRYVKDRILSSAVENSFKGLIPIGKYGFVILNIDMDPSKVDVNVHPAKLEVRFDDENQIFKAVYHAIRDTLLKAELIADTKETVQSYNENTLSNINTKPTITDLFRKIKKEDKKETEEIKDNAIYDIYTKKTMESKNPVSVEERRNEIEEKRKEAVKELIAMQQKLKQEAENDPSLHTNIDALISKTQQMQGVEKNEYYENEETKNDNQTEVEMKETSADYEPISSIEKTEENKEQENNIEEKANIENVNVTEQENEQNIKIIEQNIEQEKAEAEDIENTNKESIQTVEKNEDSVQDINTNEETKTFTNEEIQEMMDKLENMENIEKNPEFESMYEKIFGKLPASTIEEQQQEKEKINAYELIKDDNKVSIFENIEEYQKPTYKLVGIAFNTYIIIEIEKELYIIDQHAAHERVMYEKVKENYYSSDKKDSQMLLLPDVITLTHKEMDILKDNQDMFIEAGFVFEEFGDNTIKLTGVPNICLDLDTKELFLETLDEINTVARTAKQEIEERFIATVACKAAVKANMDLTNEEVDNLMSDLLKLPNPFTCPHGRPTAIRMDKNDIEKKFARRK